MVHVHILGFKFFSLTGQDDVIDAGLPLGTDFV